MFKSLAWKFTLSFVLVALAAATLVAIFVRLNSANRLYQLVVEQQRNEWQAYLVDYYTSHGSWEGVRTAWDETRDRESPAMPTLAAQSADKPPFRSFRERRNLFGLADQTGKVIIPLGGDYPLGYQLSDQELSRGTAVEVNGKRVGTILTAPLPPPLTGPEDLFLRRTERALIFATLGAVLIALVVGLVLAHTLIRPLQALTAATRKMSTGDFGQQLKIKSSDEIGQLTHAFNQMSQEIARVNQLRRQMTADIAHELRTPLTVIAGYVESMQDGVLQPTPERLSMIYDEIEHLQKLVADLRMLSQADAGELSLHPQEIHPKELLEKMIVRFQPLAAQKEIQLQLAVPAELPQIYVDESRMMQVFDNLITNALRYTPSGGKIILSVRREADQLCFTVQDNGAGIAPEDLPFIFDRFYRGDKARQVTNEETGLGLAIAKALVEAHRGTISAESELNKGTTIRIKIPAGRPG